MEEIYFTTNTSNVHNVHGCLDWYATRPLRQKDTTVLRVRLRSNDKVLGQVVLETVEEPDGMVVWLFYLAVHPDYRKHGLGSKLVRNAVWKARKQGAILVSLHVQKEFEDTLIPWYKSLGFTEFERDKKCFDEMVMYIPLTDLRKIKNARKEV